jgi:TetR/AcrR family transcriptional repressor of nem operon
MVGGLVLARATVAANPALSDEILATLREHLTSPTEAPAPSTRKGRSGAATNGSARSKAKGK